MPPFNVVSRNSLTKRQESIGIPRETTEHEDRMILRSILTDSNSSLSVIQLATSVALRTAIDNSMNTVQVHDVN